jgi:hypothetical protein
MTFAKATAIVDRVAVAVVYSAVVLIMPFAAYSFIAPSF